MITPKFAAPKLSLHAELKKRVNDYFQTKGIQPTGNYKLFVKAALLILSYTALYIHLVFFTPTAWVAILECMLLGILTSGIGFNVMHDGSHGSFSNYPWLNNIAAKTLDMLGASSFMWNTKHNIVHHAYTNIDGVDDDLNAGMLLRMCDTQKYHKIHRYQYIYFWFLYSMLYFFWVFFTDYKKYFTNKVKVVEIKKLKFTDHLLFWTSKAAHIFFYVALPIYMVGVWPWLIGFTVYAMVAGFVLSIVFQLAHTVEETTFPQAIQPANKIEDEWALHQLKTTANFATKNKLITWWVGGLNFQVEHHLFPKVSHVHYPAISNIIKRTCAEMNVPYIEHPKMVHAIASHVAHLKKLGNQ
ncbi:MAG: acyl-CoA desaturase [Bacteroidetes bacterium]|nr:acyl-CoA desaturase [Bacteroidota bacterium]